MSDIYIPGVRSRFNSDQIIEDLMRLERIPRDRTEQNIDNLQNQKNYWRILNTRITSVQESARFLYSFQNPFNERLARSADENAITASATRQASEASYRFTVKQTAQADRFLSSPLDENTRIEGGTYTFTIGEKEKISINFRGGNLREFVDLINRRGQDKISASLIAIQTGTRSLLIESKITGAENRLNFHDDAAKMALNIGMMEQGNDSRRAVPISQSSVRTSSSNEKVFVNEGVLNASALSSVSIPLEISLNASSPLMLKLETSTRVESSDFIYIPQPPPGPQVPAGSVTYRDLTITNEPSSAPLPNRAPPEPPKRNDDMAVLSLTFSDGTSVKLPAITDSASPVTRQFSLADIAQGKTIVSLNIENTNTHRDITVSGIEVFDPTALDGGLRPLNAVSSARDAIITMEGIEITRSSNSIDDLIPGVTLNVRGVSEKPVELSVKADTEAVKDAIINFVGNYNRLMAEVNVLTSTAGSSSTRRVRDENGNWVTQVVRHLDEVIVDELTYLTPDEAAEMKNRLGAFSGDSTLASLKNNLRMAVSSPYPTDMERELSMLAQIGISTNANMNTGYSPSRLRGYLEINEKVLDAALESKIPAIKQLFANDTTGDLLNDTGVAVNVDRLTTPFTGTGGIVTLKTNTIDSRISQDERRIQTYDRQLEAKEQELRIQYARMEAAYARMEQMSNSLDNFNQQNRNNNR